MVVLTIDKIDYKVFESWSEITLKKGRELFGAASKAPENLLYIYKEQSKGEQGDKDQIRIKQKGLTKKQSDKFYKSILLVLSDIPMSVINKINVQDLRVCYDRILFQFVFGVLYYPVDGIDHLNKFDWLGKTFEAPKSKKIMGNERPFYNENTDVYCDASDLDANGRNTEFGKYHFAELIIAIVFKEYGEDYEEERAMEIADTFQDVLTCDIFHSSLYHLARANETLELLFPNLYQNSGDAKSKASSKESGLKDFGWFSSIMTVAEMGILTKGNKTPLNSVKKANLYDFMTVISNMRANSDYQKIYRDKSK